MTLSHYFVSSKAYKSNLFTGFSRLQNQEEFVDLTLAADGCLVKVHRNLIALASPYLKEILKSMPNHPPVIYLYNVSQKVLSYILEYIYQGEVNIPEDSIDTFIEVSKSLHIAGIEALDSPKMAHPRKLIEKPLERRASNIDASITTSNNNLLKFQQKSQIENFEYNVNYETDYSMEDLQQSADIINTAKFIIQDQSDKINQESTNTQPLENIPVIEIKSDNITDEIQTNAELLDYNPLLLQTNSTKDQHNPTETIQSIPIIEITPNNTKNNAQLKDYKIIVKTQNDTAHNSEASQNNIPVIEIQQVCQNSSNQDYNSTIQKALPLIQTYAITQQDNPVPQLQIDNISQHHPDMPHKIRPAIKILDDQYVKWADTSIPNTAGDQNIPLKSNDVTDVLPSDLKADMNDLKNMALYSLTERGALQLILNRYIYCCHHSTRSKRRWRCIEYRRGACPAIVDTEDGVIVARKGIHAHAFHDKKLYKKHKNCLIYHSEKLALAAWAQKKNQNMLLTEEEMDTII